MNIELEAGFAACLPDQRPFFRGKLLRKQLLVIEGMKIDAEFKPLDLFASNFVYKGDRIKDLVFPEGDPQHAPRVLDFLPPFYGAPVFQKLGLVFIRKPDDEVIAVGRFPFVEKEEVRGMLVQPGCLDEKKRGFNKALERLIFSLSGQIQEVRQGIGSNGVAIFDSGFVPGEQHEILVLWGAQLPKEGSAFPAKEIGFGKAGIQDALDLIAIRGSPTGAVHIIHTLEGLSMR
ncbi:MAG: hypothetical protein NTW71_01555 [Deltaproteobacteria bacterium]|nr:hypothetical protein [Deltaproteobacteria bacterium]